MRKIIFGDAIKEMNSIPTASVDMVRCDLPYGVTKCKWDHIIPIEELWFGWERVLKPSGVVVLTATQPFASQLIMSNPKMFRYDLIWEKPNATGFLNAKRMPLRAHEHILVFYKELPTYNPQKTTGHPRKVSLSRHKQNTKGKLTEIYGDHSKHSDYDSTERYPRSVLTFSSDKQRCSLHPTQKPLELEEYLISTYTNIGDVVLDNTAGSGTTGEACEKLGRGYILIDNDAEYVEIIKERLSQYT